MYSQGQARNRRKNRGTAATPRNLLDALRAARPGSPIPGLAGSLSASEMVSGIVEATGIARTRLDSDSAGATSIRLVLADDEAARIGVDTDAELQSLIQIEQLVELLLARVRWTDTLDVVVCDDDVARGRPAPP